MHGALLRAPTHRLQAALLAAMSVDKHGEKATTDLGASVVGNYCIMSAGVHARRVA